MISNNNNIITKKTEYNNYHCYFNVNAWFQVSEKVQRQITSMAPLVEPRTYNDVQCSLIFNLGDSPTIYLLLLLLPLSRSLSLSLSLSFCFILRPFLGGGGLSTLLHEKRFFSPRSLKMLFLDSLLFALSPPPPLPQEKIN